ncbi:MAG: glycosyltransferase family protein [Acidobacteriota bacterium]
MPRVLYVQYTNPAAYPPVEHGARILADAGCDVLLLGTENQGHSLELPVHERMRVELLPFEGSGWRQKIHYARFALWALMWTLRWRPSWVYASDPLACPVALLLARVGAAQTVYHEHDSPAPGALQASATSGFMRVVLRARRAVGRRAALCILPTESRARLFREEVPAAGVVTVWNCPSRNEVSPPRDGLEPGTLRVWYHGSIVPARMPLEVIQALARLPDGVTLTIAGYETVGHIGWVGALMTVARELGVAHRVTFLGPLPLRQDLLGACAGHDVGLALLPRSTDDINEREMVGASNKPFDYLANGLALLVSDLPAWRAMYVDPGYGRVCSPELADSIASELNWFLEHPEDVREMGERGRQRVADAWNYELTFAQVLDRLTGTRSPLSNRYQAADAAGRP